LEKKIRGLMQFLEEERLKNYNLEMQVKGTSDQGNIVGHLKDQIDDLQKSNARQD
jgi:hypothetical protein